MDGTKPITDTAAHRKVWGRQAFRLGESVRASVREPGGNENPGKSRNRAE